MEPLTLATSAIVGIVSTAIGGIIEGKGDELFCKTTKPLLDNLRRHRPEANHELQRALYCSYLQATLQACALRAQNIGINIDEWIRRQPLPGKMKRLATKLRREVSLGVFSQAESQWLFAVIGDLRQKLSLLGKDRIHLPSKENDERFKLLLDQFELLLQQNLGRLQEAIDSYDQAIAIRRRLVEVEHRDELSNDLASALMNKALALEKEERWDEALASYDEAVRMREYCVVEAGMIHLLPSLLQTVRYRLMTLLDLKRQEEAARDVLRFLGYFESFKNDAPQEATQKEFNQFVGVLRSHSDDEPLFAALGADAERIRKLM